MQDQIIAKEKWAFDSDVSQCFEDMLSRSIPQYDLMRKLTNEIIEQKLKSHSILIDIGCSTGLSFFDMAKEKDQSRFIGLEISDPMIEIAKKRFNGMPNVEIVKHDLRELIPTKFTCDVILSILTIQFVPIEYRMQLIQSIYDRLHHGGVFVFVEKVIGSTSKIDTLFTEKYLNFKESNGYSKEQIFRKKTSLEGVLVPVTAKWNEELLHTAGFKQIDCFWRFLNFAGWIAIK